MHEAAEAIKPCYIFGQVVKVLEVFEIERRLTALDNGHGYWLRDRLDRLEQRLVTHGALDRVAALDVRRRSAAGM